MKLRESKLTDDALVEVSTIRSLKTMIIPKTTTSSWSMEYMISPETSSDGAEMFDASDEIYEHIMCCICPVKLSKAGLCYNAEANLIQDRIRDWIVELPERGFLFPAFNDRSTDLHAMLYYSKKPEELQAEFVENMFGCEASLTAGNRRNHSRLLFPTLSVKNVIMKQSKISMTIWLCWWRNTKMIRNRSCWIKGK